MRRRRAGTRYDVTPTRVSPPLALWAAGALDRLIDKLEDNIAVRVLSR